MKFENAFDVQAPLEEVWGTLMDVERVAPCMPGAEVQERVGEDTFKVGIKVKVGPISMLYRGEVQIVERDDAEHKAMMRAKAREARGQGTADAHIRISLVEHPEGTHATIETELQLSGRAASMGRGVITDVSAKLVDKFAGNLAEMFAPAAVGAGPEPEEGAGGPDGAPSASDAAAPADALVAAVAGDGGAGDADALVTDGAGDAGAADADTLVTSGAGEAGATASPAGIPWPPPPPPTPRQPPQAPSRPQAALPAGEIAASVIADRLKDPRNLLLTTAGAALVFGAIGYVIGRSR
jgi:uncharacterized protein